MGPSALLQLVAKVAREDPDPAVKTRALAVLPEIVEQDANDKLLSRHLKAMVELLAATASQASTVELQDAAIAALDSM